MGLGWGFGVPVTGSSSGSNPLSAMPAILLMDQEARSAPGHDRLATSPRERCPLVTRTDTSELFGIASDLSLLVSRQCLCVRALGVLLDVGQCHRQGDSPTDD